MARPRSYSRDDWLMAGFQALVREGPGAIRAEALARQMGVTKGGFYGSFDGVAGFRDAMMARWHQLAVDDVISELNQMGAPRAKLELLIELASAPEPEGWGGPLVEPAIRGWALACPEVARAVAQVDAARVAWLGKVFEDLGAPLSEARVFYAAYVGYVTIGREARRAMGQDLKGQLDRLG